jgi:hypothetical protein
MIFDGIALRSIKYLNRALGCFASDEKHSGGRFTSDFIHLISTHGSNQMNIAPGLGDSYRKQRRTAASVTTAVPAEAAIDDVAFLTCRRVP